MRNVRYLIVLILGAALALPAAQAQEFRILNPITTPGLRAPLPAGAQPVAQPRTIDRRQLETAVQALAAAWNTPALEAQLAPNFYDKSRLDDVLNTNVPRDAKLRVLGIQGVQILDQYMIPDASGLFDTYVSRVSATVRTQVEFTSTTDSSFQRRDGTNEFILKVTQRVLR
jgi:hypothetical protein